MSNHKQGVVRSAARAREVVEVPSAPNKRVFVVNAEPAFRGVLTRLFVQALVEQSRVKVNGCWAEVSR